MNFALPSGMWAARLRAPLLALVVGLAAACESSEVPTNSDPAATQALPESASLQVPEDVDSTEIAHAEEATEAVAAATDLVDGLSFSTASFSGIPGGTFHLPTSLYGTYTGSVRAQSPWSTLRDLERFRSKGTRVFLSLSGSRNNYTNSDGTFNFTLWKQRVDRFRGINFSSYINDGTVAGHYLMDEPNCTSCWGGKKIPQSTVEAAAKYSKQIWPGMTTVVRVSPGYLKGYSGNYIYLDAAWSQYAARFGDINTYIQTNVSQAKALGLGLVMGLNVLRGGTNGSKMSASQLKSWGGAILASSYICGFLGWKYDDTYFSRSDIQSAMAELVKKARNHTKASCKVS